MLIAGIALGLILGLLAGGSIGHLASVRLRWIALLFLAVLVRFVTEAGLSAGNELVQAYRLPLFAFSFWMLIVGLWVNRSLPGLSLAFVGILLNATAIIVNGGYMPIWQPSLIAAGFDPGPLFSPFHVVLPRALDATFLLHAGPLGDLMPIPVPFIRNVASVGDLFLTAGLAFFLFATVVRTPADAAEESAADAADPIGLAGGDPGGLAGTARLPRGVRAAVFGQRVRPATSLAPALREASVLERARILGGSAARLATPGGAAAAATLAPRPAYASGEAAAPPIARPGGEVAARVRRHPYVRLALNTSFSSLWTGQLISLFGDRIHQIALVFLVAGVTKSPIAVAFVFVAITLPNLFLSPIAGTFVDRWDHKEVLVVSDLLRSAIVLLIPIVAVTNLILVYPLVFLVTTISIFFRPARVAALPRIVREDELITANSAMWVGETIADVIGYPLAAVFVGFLGSALPLAFWIDAATYAASAALIASISVPPLARRRATAGESKPRDRRSVLAEMREGYRFLRTEATLFANTIQAAVAQFTVGILTALTPLYAADIAFGHSIQKEAVYGFLETAIGAGNLIGGFVIGAIGARLARGKTVIVGYTAWGACVLALALTGNLAIALGLMFGSGIANMVYLIPSQTLFQERTPANIMGRVLGFRSAVVFGSMTIAMALSGILAQVAGVAPVIGLFGVMTIVAGLAGLFVPAVRDA